VWRVKTRATPLLCVYVHLDFRFWKWAQFNPPQSKGSNHGRGNGGRVFKTNTIRFTHLAVSSFSVPHLAPHTPQLSSLLYQLLFLALQSNFLLHSASLYGCYLSASSHPFFRSTLTRCMCDSYSAQSQQQPGFMPHTRRARELGLSRVVIGPWDKSNERFKLRLCWG